MDFLLFKIFLPEIFLSFSILFFLIYNVYLTNNGLLNYTFVETELFNQLFVIITLVLLLLLNIRIELIQNDFILISSFGISFLKKFFLFTCILALPSIVYSFTTTKLNLFEYFVLNIFVVLASLILMSSSDLILIYILLELQTLCFFVLACFDRNSTFSTESGLNYFILGSFISGLFLCGCVLIYGCAGSLNLNNIELIFSSFDTSFSFLKFICLIGGILILITFLFKIAGAPFHFWVPDVYEGASLPSTIIFSITPKIPLCLLLLKWSCILVLGFSFVKYLLVFSGILSIFFGSILALGQKRLKRLIIYSSIAQGGFIIAGCSATTNIETLSYILFFLVIFIISFILVWLQFSFFYNSSYIISNILNKNQIPVFTSSICNFFFTNKVNASSFIFIFFSIAGLPPFREFLSKILILFSIINVNIFSLIFAMILVSILSIFYYLKILKVIFFELKSNTISKPQTFITYNKNFLFTFNCLINSFLLFCLAYIYFFPNISPFFLESIILNSYFTVFLKLLFSS